MMRTLRLRSGALLLLAGTTAFAQPHQVCGGALLGTWVLLSMETTDLDTGRKSNLFGAHPNGFLSYGPDCRMSVMLTRESRAAPADLVATDAESLDLYRGLLAYMGSYTIDDFKVTHHVDVAWNQAWTATVQAFQFRLDGSTLYMTTETRRSPLSGKQSSTQLIWTKLE